MSQVKSVLHGFFKRQYDKYFIPLTGYTIERRDGNIHVYRNSMRFGVQVQKVISVCEDNTELNKVLTLIGIKKK